ncbi:hypothetical protein V8E51_000806 [Hyaloscypha variabilis]
MDALRRLSWTQSLRTKHPQSSQSSQTFPSATLSGSVRDIVHQFETNQKHPRLISSEMTHPVDSSGRSLIPNRASSYSRAANPAWETKELEQMSPRKVVKFEGESILGSYLQLPALPKGLGGNFGPDLIERFAHSRLTLAVDSAADDSDGLPPIPDTPAGYARFGFISTESFNTAVKDLVQENPDTPIGGKAAAPMTRSFSLGTRAINGSSFYLDAPQSDVLLPQTTPEDENKAPLRARSNVTDSFHEASEIDFQQNASPSSPVMITAPQSPWASRRNGLTSFSVDGPGAGGSDVRDFAQQPSERTRCPSLPDCCVSPRSLASDVCCYNADASGAKENPRAAPYLALGPVPEFDLDKTNARDVAGIPVVSNGAIGAGGVPNAQGVIIDEVGSKGPDALGLPQAPVGIGGVEIGGPNVPLNLPQAPEIGVPIDGTGQLLPPGTPPKQERKRKKIIRGVQKVIRKGRRATLRKPVLAVLVGRKLSGPTSNALKLISKDVPFDIGDLAGAVRPPAPVPGAPT